MARATAKAVEPTRPHPGWSEQNPADWWNATLEAIDKLSRAHPAEMAKVRGIGLSGHMHGATLLDKNDQVLRPCILWNDGRSAAECAEMEAALPALRDIAGNIAMPGFTAPKIAWVRKHEPEIYARIAKVLLPKAYIRLLLTGEHIEEMSDASGTLWLDVGKRDWSDQLLALTGLNRSHMPRLVEGSAASAGLKREFVTRWGMAGDVVVAGGAGDNAAAACGIGAIQPGEGFVSLGTSGVLFVSNDRFRPNTKGAVHAFCHAIPETWHQMGVILSATDSLNWLAKITGQDPATLAGAAEAGFMGPGEEIFLPYLSGERTPHNNAAARGSFTGLSHSTDPALLAQAVMEGVAFAFRDCQRVLKGRRHRDGPAARRRRRFEIRPVAQAHRHQFRYRDRAARGRRFRRRAGRRPARPLRRGGRRPRGDHDHAGDQAGDQTRAGAQICLFGTICALSRPLPRHRGGP